jgi:gliding motility-associated-like protein
VTYQWYNLLGAVIGNDSVLVVSPTTDTTYYVVSIVSGSCGAADTGYVAPGQIPDVDAGPDQEIVVGQTVEIGGSPTTSWGGSTFEWTPSISLNDSTLANPLASPDVTTTYQVMVTNIIGCTNSDTVMVTVADKFLVYSGFTPNGDGDNDVWNLPFVSEYPSAVVRVYNRWGELIFESENGYPNPWDGKHEGADVPVGTYYYVIELNDGAFPEPISGPITIMR